MRILSLSFGSFSHLCSCLHFLIYIGFNSEDAFSTVSCPFVYQLLLTMRSTLFEDISSFRYYILSSLCAKFDFFTRLLISFDIFCIDSNNFILRMAYNSFFYFSVSFCISSFKARSMSFRSCAKRALRKQLNYNTIS